jgi:AcrR family transcriptional regulator
MAPARARRPRDRKQQILRVAGAEFWSAGYHQVGMSRIAASVGIAPSALYRHFRSKQELLLAVLDGQLARRSQAASDGGAVSALIAGLTRASLADREFRALHEREAGQLPAVDRRLLWERLHGLSRVVATALDEHGAAGLRAWALLAVLDSPSFHHLEVAPDGGVLRDAAGVVTRVRLAPGGLEAGTGHASVAAPGMAPVTRREVLLAAALRLFAQRGYPSVSLTDIGTAAGMAGPSVYTHFPSKTDLLVAALQRGNETLWLGLHRALSTARDPDGALDQLVSRYTAFAWEHTDVVAVLLSEAVHLPSGPREHFRQLQSDYVTEWTELLVQARPGLPPTDARLLVHAALTIVNITSRIPSVQHSASPQDLSVLARAVLQAGLPPTAG